MFDIYCVCRFLLAVACSPPTVLRCRLCIVFAFWTWNIVCYVDCNFLCNVSALFVFFLLILSGCFLFCKIVDCYMNLRVVVLLVVIVFWQTCATLFLQYQYRSPLYPQPSRKSPPFILFTRCRHPCRFRGFLALDMHEKICTHTLICVFLVLFCVAPVYIRSFAPIQTDPHPSALNSECFWQNPKNIMSGEISPVIAIKFSPVRP